MRDRNRAQLCELALEVARAAADFALEGYRTRPHASEKAARDLVTEFDLGSEQLIRARLTAATPDIPIVAEEAGGEADAEATWYCDPLDGTTNFVHGHPFWSVSIGLLEAGIPTVGAVVAPALGLWWTGYQGGPSLRCGTPCELSATDRLEQALLATGFPVQRDHEPASNLSTFVEVMRSVQGVRRCGSAAVDLCLVADGTYDAFWERKLNGWDLCAGAAVVLGAGGRLSALDGGPADVRYGHIVASNGRIHTAVLGILRKHL